MEYTQEAPRAYAEFKLACLTGWNIDEIPAHRVDEALHFMGLEAKYQKHKESIQKSRA